MTSHSWFGDRRFRFDGEGRELFRPFVVTLLLIIPTLGLSLFWYAARKRRFLWDHTSLDAACAAAPSRAGACSSSPPAMSRCSCARWGWPGRG
jgi:hypothetical protein